MNISRSASDIDKSSSESLRYEPNACPTSPSPLPPAHFQLHYDRVFGRECCDGQISNLVADKRGGR